VLEIFALVPVGYNGRRFLAFEGNAKKPPVGDLNNAEWVGIGTASEA